MFNYDLIDLSYLMGAFMGDGCAYVSKYKGGSNYQFYITSEDFDFCEKCGYIVGSLFGIKGKINSIYKGDRLSYHYYRACNKKIVLWFREITNNKNNIPEFVKCNNTMKKAFIQGIMDADGWVFKPKASDGYTRYRVGFCNTAEWTKGVYDILQSLLVKTGKIIKRKSRKGNKDKYEIAINSRSYCEKVGFRIDRKNKLAQDCLQFYKNKEIKNE